MHYSKRMIGERAGNGVVPMNSPLPRPPRQTAVGELTDGPYPHFSVAMLKSLSATVEVDVGAATVNLEATNGDPNDADVWTELDTVTITAEAGSLEAVDVAFMYARFTVAASDPARTIKVDFFGKG